LKHLFSLATLAATATLALALTASAKADLVASTTAAPNPSGYATCTGTNADGSTATWTVGGKIYFTSDYSNPTAHVSPGGYHNIKPGKSGNPYDGSGGNPCIFQVSPSNNTQSNTTVQVSMKLTYTPYSGNSPSTQDVDRRAVSGLTGGFTYTFSTSSFAPLLDVKNAQFKVTSDQGTGSTPGTTLGTAATPYL
jgi:hypothetical protein